MIRLAAAAAATYRLTRLITEDTITAPLRDTVLDRIPPTDPRTQRYTVTYPLTCEYCASVYAAAAVTVLDHAAHAEGVPRAVRLGARLVLGTLALSGAACLYYEYKDAKPAF